MMDDANAGCGGFSTWPHAVQFLLESYATNENIQQAVEELEDMQMNPKETIKEFEIRITSAARELAGAYPQNALVNRFIRNLPADARAIVRLKSPSLTGPAALKLSKITEIATAYHASHSAIKVPVNKGVRFQSLAIEEEKTSKVANLGPPTRSTANSDGAPPDPYDAVHLVSNGKNSVRNQFPSRPVSNGDTRRRANEFFPLVCFTCFNVGHRSTECQHRLRVSNDDQFIPVYYSRQPSMAACRRHWLIFAI